MIKDMRELGAYSATKLKTANLDKLADGGIPFFNNGYSSSSPARLVGTIC